MIKKMSFALGIFLVSTALGLHAPAAIAEIVATDQVGNQNPADAERQKVQSFLERADVKERLLAFGVQGLVAKERVAALSDQEIHTLSQKIDSLPAGGNLSSMSNSDLSVILLLLILVAILV